MVACTSTLSVTKICMLVSKHNRLIECRGSSSNVTEVLSQQILTYVRPLLSKESYIDGDEQA